MLFQSVFLHHVTTIVRYITSTSLTTGTLTCIYVTNQTLLVKSVELKQFLLVGCRVEIFNILSRLIEPLK
jgi:hypothetical protein